MELGLKDDILAAVDEIMSEEYHYHEYGYDKPNPEYFEHAKTFIVDFMYTIDKSGYELLKPYIVNSAEGGVTFQWQSGNKKTLYFDIEHGKVSFLKVWIENSGTFTDNKTLKKNDYVKTWEWYINNEQSGQTLLF